MIISQTNQSCGFFQGKYFETFCSPACLLSEFENERKKRSTKNILVFFADYEDKKFVRSDSTFFLITNTIPTVMNSGVLTFKNEEHAKKLINQPDEFVTNWVKYRLIAGIPDNIVKVKITDDLMEPEILRFNKDELIQIEIEKTDLLNEQSLFIKGYEEISLIRTLKNEAVLMIKFFTEKPGAGFPIMINGIKKPVGMMKVLGAHTLDEEIK